MRPNPGAPRKDFFNKKFYDDQTRVIPQPVNSPTPRYIDPNGTIVTGIIASDATNASVDPYKPVVLGIGNVITPSSDLQHLQTAAFPCVTHDDPSSLFNRFNPNWGISLDFITKSTPGRVLISGGGWLNTTGIITLAGNSIDIFNRKLWFCHGGKAEVMSAMVNNWAYVVLGRSTMTWLGRTTVSGISLTAAGNVTLYERKISGTPLYELTTISVSCLTSVSPIVGEVDVEVTIKAGNLYASELC